MVLSCVEAGRRLPVRVADFEITPGATGSGYILTPVAAAEAPGWVYTTQPAFIWTKQLTPTGVK
jgi:hypothetical protein